MPPPILFLRALLLAVLAGPATPALPAAPAPDASGAPAPAAPAGALFGRVVDAHTGRPLAGCRVRLFPADTAVATDSSGRFRVSGLVPGAYRAVFIRRGYEAAEDANVMVGTGGAEEVLARLVPASADSALVLADAHARGAARSARSLLGAAAGSYRYGRNDVLRSPGALGDISLFAQGLPGVTRGNDQATDLAVRGGGPDENAYLVDGIPIFNINHFEDNNRDGGGIGNINTYFLEDVQLHTGAFSARYPDRLSSVMDIAFKRGNPSARSGMATLDVAGMGGLLEGPLPGGGEGGTFGVTARASSLSLLDQLGIIEFGGVPRYGNGHLKVNGAAGPWDLSFNLLGGADGYDAAWIERGVDREERLHSDNLFAGLRATRGGDAWRTSLYAAGNTRRFRYEEEQAVPADSAGIARARRFEERSGGARALWGVDVDRFLGKWTLRFGGLQEYDVPEIDKEEVLTLTGADGDAGERTRLSRATSYHATAAYGELAFASGPWDLTGGARVLYDEYTGDLFAGPRAQARRRLGDHALKAAVGLHTQSQAARAFGAGRPEGEGRLPYNVQSVAGADLALPFGVSLRVEAFDKQGFRMPRTRADGALRDTGRTVSRGVDLYLRKALRERLWGSAAYTFAWNRDRRGGKWAGNAYSVPHTFSGTLGYDLARRLTASLRLGAASGAPYTRLPADPETPLDPALRWSRYAGTYFRLDTRVEYRHPFPGATLGGFLEITNLTDNENLFAEEEFFLDPGWGFLPVAGLTLSF